MNMMLKKQAVTMKKHTFMCKITHIITLGTYAHYFSKFFAANTNAPISLAEKCSRLSVSWRDSLVWRQKFLKGNAHKSLYYAMHLRQNIV